ncbi:DUF2059 domain-containing protein [bacterium]|nr:DUF2059 domain-containing protein [bacterium]
MKRFVIAAVCIGSLALSGADINVAEAAREKRALVHELLRITSTKEQAQQIFATMIRDMPKESQVAMSEILNVDEMVAQVVPVYEKHYSSEELRGIIAFYNTPIGQRMLAVQPLIIQDSMIVMKVYVQKKLAEKLKE